MANSKHLSLLQRGISAWNQWRDNHPDIKPDLTGTDFSSMDLRGLNLSNTDLSDTVLLNANLSGANLRGANVSRTILGATILSEIDLSQVYGLTTVIHQSPSIIDISTIYISQGNIPEAFLRGAGVPETFIIYMRSLTAQPIEFFSCFISYSHSDKDFARRLHQALQERGVRAWLDEHFLLPGHDIHSQIDSGIKLWDRVLLCCSRDSLNSNWVDKEIEMVLVKEKTIWDQTGKHIPLLIPLNLDGYLFSGEWNSPLAAQLKSRLAADFTNYKNNEKFQEQLENLLRALKASNTERFHPQPEAQSFSVQNIVAGTLAHRVRNTLATIRETARDAEEDLYNIDRVKSLLDVISRLSTSDLAAVDDLDKSALTIAATDAGPVSVNDVIKQTLEYYYGRPDKNLESINVEQDLNSNLPEARGEERWLTEILRNLLDNALDAVRDKVTKRIKIKTAKKDSSIIIDISDNGAGIPPQIAKNLLTRPVSRKSNRGSHGWGLVLSRTIAEAWGGNLRVLRTSSKGTTFRITLPVWRPLYETVRLKRALIIDDSYEWSNMLARRLSQRGLSVNVANTIAEATRLIHEQQFDLAIIDQRLQTLHSSVEDDNSGIRLASLAREINPDALIVILTGHLTLPTAQAAYRAGADDAISKSTPMPEFDRLLDNMAVRREIQRESVRQSQTNKLMYETLSMVSHELRSPLLIIQRYAEALDLGALGELNKEQSKAVEAILSSVRREFALLNAHLDLNRIERGIEKLQYQDCDLVELVRQEVAAHQAEAEVKHITLNTDLPKDKATVRIDITRFRVALNPLMDNAIKFSPDGGQIQVRVRVSSGYVVVSIADQGPGINPDELEQLMNLQSEVISTTQRIRSSGLGLSMAKRMIELHNGRLWIESDGKSGTTVSFRLPIE